MFLQVDLVRHYSNRPDLLLDLEHLTRNLHASLSDGAETSISVRSDRKPGPSRRICDRLSEADLASLVANFQSGLPVWRVTERYSIGRTSVKRILRDRKARSSDIRQP